MSVKLFILQDYHECKKLEFNTILTKVSNGLYGTANIGSFPSPTIGKVAFTLLVTDYREANNQYEAGGKDEKPAYDTALTAMIAGLDSGKAYVEGLPELTVDLINLSGFTPNKQSVSSSTVPDAPLLNKFTRLLGGGMTFDYDSVVGAEFYETYLVEGPALPVGAVYANGKLDYPKNSGVRLILDGTKQRFKVYLNLTIGQEYTIFPTAGNSAGVSALGIGTTFTVTAN